MKKLIDILLEYNEEEVDKYLKINGKRKCITPFIIVKDSEKLQNPEQ